MNTNELINIIVANRIADIHICMPAKIIKYDYKTRKADVQPGINQKYNDGEVVILPIIHNVPVIHPAAGGASIIFPVKIGDSVLLMFSEKSLEEWLQDGNQVTPDDPRQNDLTDAIAIIGLFPFSSPSPAENGADLLIDFSGNKIKLKPDGNIDILTTLLSVIANQFISGNLDVDGHINSVGYVNTAENYKVDNITVVKEQQPTIVELPSPSGLPNLIATVNQIIQTMKAHGLIAPL